MKTVRLNVFSKLTRPYRNYLRKKINKRNIDQLKNIDFSIVSSNCNGAFLLHDLKQRFLSPTVNLWFEPKDFIEFVKNLEVYLTAELVFLPELEEERGYPVGILNNRVKVYFQHYRTREQAKEKWVQRCSRVRMDNLFIIFTDRDGCTYEDLQEFDALPYRNKVVFTNKEYNEFKSAYYIKGFENAQCVGDCFSFKGSLTGEKYYDDFPYIKWLNGEIISK